MEKTPPPQGKQLANLQGKRGHGIIADHYDRDGDGRYEECRRPGWVYYDRNGDGLVDLQIYTEEDRREIIKWDENFDGIMDWSVVHDIGDFSAGWGTPQRIHEAASRVFLDDRIIKVEHIPATTVDYHAWDNLSQRTIGVR